MEKKYELMKRTSYRIDGRREVGCKRCVEYNSVKRCEKSTVYFKKGRAGDKSSKCKTCSKKLTSEVGQAEKEKIAKALFLLGVDIKNLNRIAFYEINAANTYDANTKIQKEKEEGSHKQAMGGKPVYQSDYAENQIETLIEEAAQEKPEEYITKEEIGELEQWLSEISPMNEEVNEEQIEEIVRDFIIKEEELSNNGTPYQTEEQRIKSFEEWKCPFFTAQDMARAGFYYTGEMDKVRCFDCCIEVSRWEPSDIPLGGHKKWERMRFS